MIFGYGQLICSMTEVEEEEEEEASQQGTHHSFGDGGGDKNHALWSEWFESCLKSKAQLWRAVSVSNHQPHPAQAPGFQACRSACHKRQINTLKSSSQRPPKTPGLKHGPTCSFWGWSFVWQNKLLIMLKQQWPAKEVRVLSLWLTLQ